MSVRGAKPDAWMPLFIGDYHADTTRLTTEQHGAYLLLIMDYWRTGSPPDDDAVLAQITKLDRKAWLKHRPTLARFFQVEAGVWVHKRIEEELGKAQERSDKAATRASVAAQARWERERAKQSSGDASGNAPSIAPGTACAVLEECPSPSPSPIRVEATPLVAEGDGEPGPKVKKQPSYPEAFEALWKAYPHKKGRSSKPDALAQWRRLDTPTREALPEAARRYAKGGDEPNRECGAPAMERWLKRELYAEWVAAEPERPAYVFPGPADLWSAVVARKGEAWAQTWFGYCRWVDLPRPALIAKNGVVADRIRQEIISVLSEYGATVLQEKAA
jgi:uncharacterized protein YdaU (DUF1376 family)